MEKEILQFLYNQKDYVSVIEFFNSNKDAWKIFTKLNEKGLIYFKAAAPNLVEMAKGISPNHTAKITIEGIKYLNDFKTSERVYKTYPTTRFITWASFIISVVLGVLKLIEAIKK